MWKGGGIMVEKKKIEGGGAQRPLLKASVFIICEIFIDILHHLQAARPSSNKSGGSGIARKVGEEPVEKTKRPVWNLLGRRVCEEHELALFMELCGAYGNRDATDCTAQRMYHRRNWQIT
ncbi:hypothetical protein L1887_20514 [Cichorium endivia]|nr:hypothetical protein L1887_20514 [Cichorium endivia]